MASGEIADRLFLSQPTVASHPPPRAHPELYLAAVTSSATSWTMQGTIGQRSGSPLSRCRHLFPALGRAIAVKFLIPPAQGLPR